MPTGPSTILDKPPAGFPIEHEWSKALAEKFYAWEEQNLRLLEAILKIDFKARMGLGTALAEWLVWRFEGQADLELAHQAIEACWAAVVHPAYCKPLGFEPKTVPTLSKVAAVDGPLRIGLSILRETRGRYAKGKPDLASSVGKLALLDQHVIPAQKEFEAWLKAILARTAKALPAGPIPDSEVFDPTAGTPVAREFFFDPEFKPKESNRKALQAFLAKLDPKKNPFLRTPAEMKKEGFTGTPYELA